RDEGGGDHITEAKQAIGDDEGEQPAVDRSAGPRRGWRSFGCARHEGDDGAQAQERQAPAGKPKDAPIESRSGKGGDEQSRENDARTDAGKIKGDERRTARPRQAV